MWIKYIDRYPYGYKHFPEQYKNQKVCKSFDLWETFMLQYCRHNL